MNDQVSSRTSRLPALRNADMEVMMDVPSTDYVLHSYVLRISRCQCLTCGHVAASSALFELYASMRNKGSRRLAPAKYQDPQRDVAIEQLPVTQTRVCHECITTATPLPTNEELRLFARKLEAGSAWDEKAKRALLQREAATEGSSRAKAKPTKMEDLL